MFQKGSSYQIKIITIPINIWTELFDIKKVFDSLNRKTISETLTH